MDIRSLRFSNTVCRHCGCQLPIGWEVALLEAVKPRFIDGQVNLEQKWLDERGIPILEDAIISSTEPETVLEGMDSLTEEELELVESGEFIPMEDCWQEVVNELEDLIPDDLPSDSLFSCDFCHQDMNLDEPAIRIRHCTIVENPRDRKSIRLEPEGGYSDFVMCLSCARTMSREILPMIDGKNLWHTL